MLKTLLVVFLLTTAPPSRLTPDSVAKTPRAAAVQQPNGARETFWQRTASDPVALYTGLLAVFTAALVGFTAVLAFVSIRQGRQIEREFISTHRPKLQVRQMALIRRDGDAFVEFVVTNSGGSPATIVESNLTPVVKVKNEPLPARPYAVGKDSLKGRRIETGEAAPVSYIDPRFRVLIAALQPDATTLFFVGYLVYEDASKTRRRTAFCRMYDPATQRLRTLDDPDYEYAD